LTKIFIVSAPSGSGKSTLLKALLGAVDGLLFSISYTTRDPRGEEKDGVDYNFVSREYFKGVLAQDGFLEWAEVFGDHYYGTHRRFYDEAVARGLDLVLDIDVQGARQLKVKFPDAVSVFVLPPSRQELEKRLRLRGDVSDEVIRRRLRQASKEIRGIGDYDYVIVNRDLPVAEAELIGIVRAERQRLFRMKDEIKPVLETFDERGFEANG
jgi:guanylate kinase